MPGKIWHVNSQTSKVKRLGRQGNCQTCNCTLYIIHLEHICYIHLIETQNRERENYQASKSWNVLDNLREISGEFNLQLIRDMLNTEKSKHHGNGDLARLHESSMAEAEYGQDDSTAHIETK